MSCRAISAWLLGILFFLSTGLCLADDETRVMLGEPSAATKDWMPGDVPVTDGRDSVKPAITSAPNGDLYLAAEELGSGWFYVYQSTNGGHTWEWLVGFRSNDESRNPSIAYGEHSNGEKWVYVAYESVVTADDTRRVRVFRFNPVTIAWDDVVVDGPFIMSRLSDEVHPQIITDFVDWGDGYYPYVTYSKFEIDHYPVFSSRSTDRGVSWSTPLNVTGGSENTSWATRPAIAYGLSGLFITFVKPAWNGYALSNQIWVTKSSDYGGTFATPVQYTASPNNVRPAIAAAHGTNSIVVAFTQDWGAGSDKDVFYFSSTDGGTNWSPLHSLPWTIDDESSVDLAVSNSGGYFHAAYKHQDFAGPPYIDEIWYVSASVAAPTVWSSAVVVNEGNTASATYPRPTITVNPANPVEEEAAIAWTDYRAPYVYFDSAGLPLFADGFESGDTTLWSSTVP